MMKLQPRWWLVGMLAVLLAACDSDGLSTSTPQAEPDTVVADSATAPIATHRITILVELPENAPTDIYLAGNLPELGPWHPAALKTEGSGQTRTAVIDVPSGHNLEFKVTAGSWEQEGLGASGTVMPPFRVLADQDKSYTATIAGFRRDPRELIADWQGSGVEGELVYWTDFPSQHLKLARHVVVWLPPGYDAEDGNRYRVIYTHDGQNLFDPRLSYTNVDWGIDEAMMNGVRNGDYDPAIIVGIWNTPDRLWEYSPWHDGPAYARFVIEELMPKVESEFNVLSGPENTFSLGSSMGGLISFYLVTRHPEVFSACGCVSSHVIWSPQQAAFMKGDSEAAKANATPYALSDITNGLNLPPDNTRLFFDYGSEGYDATYAMPTKALTQWLQQQGYVEGVNLKVQDYPGADHNEASWRDRVGDQLLWLLAN